MGGWEAPPLEGVKSAAFGRKAMLPRRSRGIKIPLCRPAEGEKEKRQRGDYLETVYHSPFWVVVQPSPSTIFPVLAFTGSTVVTPGL